MVIIISHFTGIARFALGRLTVTGTRRMRGLTQPRPPSRERQAGGRMAPSVWMKENEEDEDG